MNERDYSLRPFSRFVHMGTSRILATLTISIVTLVCQNEFYCCYASTEVLSQSLLLGLETTSAENIIGEVTDTKNEGKQFSPFGLGKTSKIERISFLLKSIRGGDSDNNDANTITETSEIDTSINEEIEKQKGDDSSDEEKHDSDENRGYYFPELIDGIPVGSNNDTNIEEYLLKIPNDESSLKDIIPNRFLQKDENNIDKAKKSFLEYVKWRCKGKIDTILSKPHVTYDICKSILPHYFLGYYHPEEDDDSNNKHIIFIQRPGQLRYDNAVNNNMTMDELLKHYVYISEYCWNILCPSPSATMLCIVDLKGVKLKDFMNKDVREFMKLYTNLVTHYYPCKAYKTLIINVPKWFTSVWNFLKPMLSEQTKSSILILGRGGGGTRGGSARQQQHDQSEILKKYLLSNFANGSDGDNDKEAVKLSGLILSELLGTPADTGEQEKEGDNNEDESNTSHDDSPFSKTEIEKELRSFVLQRIEETKDPDIVMIKPKR